MTDLEKLIAAVEVGDESWVHLPRIRELHTDLVWKAWSGSLDAALALFNALLPGWGWRVQLVGPAAYACAVRDDELHEALDPTPARALLLATLRAYAKQETTQ